VYDVGYVGYKLSPQTNRIVVVVGGTTTQYFFIAVMLKQLHILHHTPNIGVTDNLIVTYPSHNRHIGVFTFLLSNYAYLLTY
jgi:hypothetical protein